MNNVEVFTLRATTPGEIDRLVTYLNNNMNEKKRVLLHSWQVGFSFIFIWSN